MKITMKTILFTLMMGLSTLAGANVVQVWECKLNEGKTEAELMKASSAWLAAAKSMKGGEEFKVYHEYPLAANAGDGRFNFILIVPGTEKWGVFMGGYQDSAAAAADEAWGEAATCTGSSLWESVPVK
jgi:hypothetical protein